MTSRTVQDPELIDVRFAVTDVLIKEEVRSHLISLEEALIMQAAADLLSTKEYFYPTEIADLTGVHPGQAARRMRKLKADNILESHKVRAEQTGKGATRCLYSPTDLGRTVFGLFKEEPVI